MSKVIQLQQFQNKKKSFFKSSVNSDYYVSKSNSEVNVPNGETKEYISNNALVSFIIDYGIKVEKSDSEIYTKRMLKHYKTITFYGINYYLNFNEFDQERYIIFDYLIKNYSATN